MAGGDSRVRRIDRYTKTTALMQGGRFNQRLTACRMVLLSDPPAGCSGVEVRGVADPMLLPGARRLRNGVIQTDTVRLVGTWDGYALCLTEPPLRATPAQARPDPVAAPATPRALAAQQRLVADMRELGRHGVLIMQCAPTVTPSPCWSRSRTTKRSRR